MEITDDPSWCRALRLSERAELLAGTERSAAFDEELARSELALWRSQAPFDTGDWLARRLAADGLTEADLLRALGEPPEVLRELAGGPPAFARALAEAFADPGPGDWFPALEAELESARTLGILLAVRPVLWRGRERIRIAAERLLARFPDAPFEPERAAEALVANLPWPLHSMMSRAFVQELNIARLEDRLPGESGEERFGVFVARLREPEHALGILALYPVLARAAVEAVDRFAAFGCELLGHLAEDARAVRDELLDGRPLGRLAAAKGGAGDVHRGGRSVVLLDFDGGEKLVYKPRSLAGDRAFAALVRWLNERGDHPDLRAPRALDRGDHGWVGHVAAAPCADRGAAARFHRRQGGLLALLHVLQATDFHFENLIAAGEHPVPVDLETLFHPHAPAEESDDVPTRLVARSTRRSVMRVGLLPERSWEAGESEGVDISGMTSVAGQLTPAPVLQWEGIATDEMRAVKRRMEMPGGQNLAVLGERELSALDYRDEIAGGFEEVYRTCLAHRDELLAADGPLAAFAEVPQRVVLRATRGYGVLVQETWHPDLQGDALELERFLDRAWTGIEDSPWLAPAVPEERRDLGAGDVPLFTARPSSRDVVSSRGTVLRELHGESGLEAVRARLAEMGETDLARQLWFVRAALSTLALSDERLQWPSYAPVADVPAAAPEELRARALAHARAAGDALVRTALREDGEVAWVGLDFVEKRWNLAALADDLYGGAPGVALFLAWLGDATGEGRYTEVARSAMERLRRNVEHGRSRADAMGAFGGMGGAAWALAQCAALWDDAALREEAWLCAESLAPLIERDEDLDVMGGSAGAAMVLLGLREGASPARAARLLELARACGERLVATAVPQEVGVGWLTRIQTERPITGFSHGASGIAWALAGVARATGEERFRAAALDAVLCEDSHYVSEAGNWRDAVDPRRRGQPGGESVEALSMAWCYGAPGIGLARHALARELDHPRVREDLDAAVKATLERGFGRNHCLCHGDLGNLDVLSIVAAERGDGALRAELDRRLARTLASLDRDGFACGVPLAVESPGLMNGIAGIGYGLLRQVAPERVPSVLALEPPRRGA